MGIQVPQLTSFEKTLENDSFVLRDKNDLCHQWPTTILKGERNFNF